MESLVKQVGDTLTINFLPVVKVFSVPQEDRNQNTVLAFEVKLIEHIVALGAQVGLVESTAPVAAVIRALARTILAIGTGPEAIEVAAEEDLSESDVYQLALLGAADLYANTASFHGIVGSLEEDDPELGNITAAFIRTVNRSMGLVLAWMIAILRLGNVDINAFLLEVMTNAKADHDS